MIQITIDIEEDKEGVVSVHTKAHAIGTMREAVYAKTILHATEVAQKWVSERFGGKHWKEGEHVEIIRPIGEG